MIRRHSSSHSKGTDEVRSTSTDLSAVNRDMLINVIRRASIMPHDIATSDRGGRPLIIVAVLACIGLASVRVAYYTTGWGGQKSRWAIHTGHCLAAMAIASIVYAYSKRLSRLHSLLFAFVLWTAAVMCEDWGRLALDAERQWPLFLVGIDGLLMAQMPNLNMPIWASALGVVPILWFIVVAIDRAEPFGLREMGGWVDA
eukprot:Hpha_TRINITY_DN14724_c0_g1::TRINITY_DN14724_c0_g1_i1::g.103192::m.103192